MDLLQVAVNIIAIIAIIAVGAFIILFLADLVISIVDDHQGIFFRRNKGKDKTLNKENNLANNNNNLNNQFESDFSFDFDDDSQSQPKQKDFSNAQNSFNKMSNTIDFEQARKEQEMLEKNASNAFTEAQKEEEEEEKLRLQRIEELEKRNKELQMELENKVKEEEEEDKIHIPDPLDKLPSLNEIYNDSVEDEDKLEDEDVDLEDEEDLSDYEDMIKEINKSVLSGMSGTKTDSAEQKTEVEQAKQKVKTDIDALVKETYEEDILDEEDEEDIEETSQQVLENKNLEEELRKLKEELEKERQENEKLKVESKQTTQNLIEEKEKLEQALKDAKTADNEAKQNVTALLGSEQEYTARLEILNLRLKEAKKQLRKNKAEFVPLNKIKKTLEKDQRKLRRKEAKVAKQKVALFGVNKTDIDPKKQAELEQEIDMLEGLKLSVQHCEDVMKENEDRFPILKTTNDILTANIKNIEADIEQVEKALKAFKDGNSGK